MSKYRILRALALAVMTCALSGCWDAKEIQDINYITALGVDYKKDQYVVYVQMFDFTSVAKQEGGKPVQKANVWVGKHVGASLNDALDKLYQSSQQLMFYSHINAIIYSETVLKHGPEVAFDLTNRYRELRYTKWVYSTRDSIEALLSTTPFFNESPLSSILHEPRGTFKQSSYIVPVQFQRFISYFNEQGRIAWLPSLSINKTSWSNNLKKHELLETVGCIFMDRKKMSGYLSKDDLIGLRWVSSKTDRAPVVIKKDGHIVATIVINKPKVHIEPIVQGNILSYTIRISLKGSLNELAQNTSEEKLIEMAKQQIVEEIYTTYNEGLKRHIDIYQLGHALYLRDPAKWKQFFDSDSFPLQMDSLRSVDVRLRIENTGKYKLRT